MLAPVALAILLSAAGCGGATAAETAEAGTTPRVGELADPRMHPSLDALRPDGSQAIFERLEANPRDAAALADGAALYADTSARGMTLLWGQMALLLEPASARVPALSATLRGTLEAGISRSEDSIQVHLAPGAVPVLAFGDGSYAAPFAYLFEQAIATIGTVPHDYESAAEILRMYPRTAGQAPMGSAETQLSLYLRGLSDRGLIDAYAHWALGAAYPDEWLAYRRMNEPTVQTLFTFLSETPFAPTDVVRPDELRRVRR